MAPRPPISNTSDHDLLIRIDTRVEILATTVRETSLHTAAQLERLDNEKAGRPDLDLLRRTIEDTQKDSTSYRVNQQKQLDALKRLVYIGVGAAMALQVVLQIVGFQILQSAFKH